MTIVNPLVAWEAQTAAAGLLRITVPPLGSARRRSLAALEAYAEILGAMGARPEGDTDEAMIERAMTVGVEWAHAQVVAALVVTDAVGLGTGDAKRCALDMATCPSAANAGALAASLRQLASGQSSDLALYLHGAAAAAVNLALALDASRSPLLRVLCLGDVLSGVGELGMTVEQGSPDEQATYERTARLVTWDLARAIRGAL